MEIIQADRKLLSPYNVFINISIYINFLYKQNQEGLLRRFWGIKVLRGKSKNFRFLSDQKLVDHFLDNYIRVIIPANLKNEVFNYVWSLSIVQQDVREWCDRKGKLFLTKYFLLNKIVH